MCMFQLFKGQRFSRLQTEHRKVCVWTICPETVINHRDQKQELDRKLQLNNVREV